MTGGQL